jgi:hypothetical protein
MSVRLFLIRFPLFLFILFVFSQPPLFSDETTRVPYELNESYQGVHQASFQKLRWEVPSLVRQTMIDLSVRLGLDFNEGWRYPLTIGFIDGAPFGVENILAYVQLSSNETGIIQTLNINLEAYDRESFDFKKVFAHEMVHAMLNDQLGAEAAMVFPVWLHEGLAVYGSNQGESMVLSYVSQLGGSAERRILTGLEGSHGGYDYAEDYLALKYLVSKHGQNCLHNFLKEVVRRQGDIPGALKYTCFETWDDFQKNAMVFSREEIRSLDPHRRRDYQRPY